MFAMHNIKANVRQENMELTNLAYMICAVIIRAKTLRTLKGTGREMIRQPSALILKNQNQLMSYVVSIFLMAKLIWGSRRMK